MQLPRHRAAVLKEIPMVPPNVVSLFSSTIADSSVPGSSTNAIAYGSEGPCSVPTILVEVDEVVVPTALPAPPRMPSLIVSEDWHPPPMSPVPVIRPALVLVEPSQDFSRRPTVRLVQMRSRKLRAVSSSIPPTMPPPSPAMRRVA
jgi:hypothetical protein